MEHETGGNTQEIKLSTEAYNVIQDNLQKRKLMFDAARELQSHAWLKRMRNADDTVEMSPIAANQIASIVDNFIRIVLNTEIIKPEVT